MSKAGQNTFSGISHQADITIAFLLNSLKDPEFQSVVVEGDNWEDFTLIYLKRHEDYEVKWHKKALSYRDIQLIICKELKKKFQKQDRLVIVAKKFSQSFLKDYRFLKSGLYWWTSLDNKIDEKNQTVRKFLNNGWTPNEISFLTQTEIKEMVSSNEIQASVEEYFAVDDPFYLSIDDQFSIVSRTFKRILEKGSQGGTITRAEFEQELQAFKIGISEKSESFAPKIEIKNKVVNLKPFLKNGTEFQKLNHPKYLTPISANRRLIFYLAKNIESADMTAEDVSFFIDKILIKKHYSILSIKVLKKKWEKKKANPEHMVSFIVSNYRRFVMDVDHDIALNILSEIVTEDVQNKFRSKILGFLEKEILIPLTMQFNDRNHHGERGWQEKHLVSKILSAYFERTANKKPFIDFIFRYFDFTGDDFQYVIKTDTEIYAILKKYIGTNYENNFEEILIKIIDQYQLRFKGIYKGYELVGGGISQAGSHYSIIDIGIVRFLFRPLFEEYYRNDRANAWEFFTNRILSKPRRKASLKCPLFLRRSLIGILLDRLEDIGLPKKEKDECLLRLIDILLTRKGIPNTQEIIFDMVRNRDMQKIGYDTVMYLIEQDGLKFKSETYPGGYPTNLFVISTLIKLTENGYRPARDFLLNLVRKPEFSKHDRFYDLFELLGASEIFKSDPDFVFDTFTAIDLPSYLNNHDRDMVWDKSATLQRLIEKDWEEGKDRGKKLIADLLQGEPSQSVLEFIGNPIHQLIKINALKTFSIFGNYLMDKVTFCSTFKKNTLPRQNIVWLAEALARQGNYDEAQLIIDLCIDDPDPETSNNIDDIYNYHLKVKNGDDSMGITTVRGTVAWALQPFAMSENPGLLVYALEKTELLLDLDGKLAEKLGYCEPDYYVRLQALVPFGQLLFPQRRQKLEQEKTGLGNHVKDLALQLVRTVANDCRQQKIKLSHFIERLTQTLPAMYDLNTKEAREIWDFFELSEEPEAVNYFSYYSIARKDHFKEVEFDPQWFEERFSMLCKEENPFRANIAIEIFRSSQASKENLTPEAHFNKVEKYFDYLFENYQEKVYGWIYQILGNTLTWTNRYKTSLEFLKRALSIEICFLKNTGINKYSWALTAEMLETIKEKSIEDYLDVMNLVVLNINDHIHYAAVISEIPTLKSLSIRSDIEKNKFSELNKRLKELYPDEFEAAELDKNLN